MSEVQDAARYRWLRGRDLSTHDSGGVFAGLPASKIVLSGDDLDRAVDRAMEAEHTIDAAAADFVQRRVERHLLGGGESYDKNEGENG